MTSLSHRSPVVLGLLASILTVAPLAQTQRCPGSHLLYLVRDANGSPVQAAAASFTFQGSAGPWSWHTLRSESYDGFESKMPPPLLKALKGTIAPLWVFSRSCAFRDSATLSVTMSGKTMDLLFNVAAPETVGSYNLLVEGPPFQEGRFEITPIRDREHQAKGQHYFYSAKEWTKK